MNPHFFTAPFCSGVARGAWCPLAANESSARQLGVRSVGAAHKNQKRLIYICGEAATTTMNPEV